MSLSTQVIAPELNGFEHAVRAVLRTLLRLSYPTFMNGWAPIALQRIMLRAVTGLMTVSPRKTHCEAVTLGGVLAELSRPVGSRPSRYVLYLHGGAFISGSPATHRAITGHLAHAMDAGVIALSYRLSPENPAPAAVTDVLTAWEALLASGADASRCVIAGDSAGGNLALSACIRIASEGGTQPAAVYALSPFLDLSLADWHTPEAGDPMIRRSWAELGASLYCTDPDGLKDAAISPMFATLSGLPPVLLQVGEDEVLLNDSIQFADRAAAAGVTVSLERYPGCWHVFQIFAGRLAIADRAIARAADYVIQKMS